MHLNYGMSSGCDSRPWMFVVVNVPGNQGSASGYTSLCKLGVNDCLGIQSSQGKNSYTNQGQIQHLCNGSALSILNYP